MVAFYCNNNAQRQGVDVKIDRPSMRENFAHQ